MPWIWIRLIATRRNIYECISLTISSNLLRMRGFGTKQPTRLERGKTVGTVKVGNTFKVILKLFPGAF
jgi:hypothetical protein